MSEERPSICPAIQIIANCVTCLEKRVGEKVMPEDSALNQHLENKPEEKRQRLGKKRFSIKETDARRKDTSS